MVGNSTLVNALARIKSYFDYGTFTPVQVASVIALEDNQSCVEEICMMYQLRRDCLVKGLHEIGWMVETPKATMYLWAEIPNYYKKLGSLEFSKKLLLEAKVAISPGVGFGEYGDNYVRFALIENDQRIRQAVRGIKDMFKKDGFLIGSCSKEEFGENL
jgi:alanine-synthesizing transaminase